MIVSIAILLFLQTVTNSLQYLCPNSYFFDSQHCQTCLPNCVCTVQNTCSYCLPGYTLFRGNCIQCPQSNGIYGECSSCCSNINGTILTCTDCTLVANKYSFLFSGRCISSDGCFQVDKNGFCIDCKRGFYQTNNQCFKCHSSCLTCTDINHCLSCALGYYWAISDGGLCSSCPNGCSRCDNNGNCTQCLQAYYQYNNHCLSCPVNCKTCIDGSTCTSCSQGIMVSNLCIKCDDTSYGGTVGCLSCLQTNNFIQCSICEDLYYLDSNGDCQKCQNSITGALRCKDGNTPTQCKDDHVAILTNRYYLLGISCIQNTKSCKKIASITGACSSCYDGYIIDINSACIKCNFTGCKPLNSSSNNNVCICTQCESGYYLNGNLCIQCTTSQCSVCPSDTCTACLTNFYWNGVSNCLPSTAQYCLQASSATLCSICIDGYYLRNDNNCYSCQTNCLRCSSSNTCLQCDDNFLLSSGYCISYPSNCVELVGTNFVPIKCSLCKHGYYLNQGNCIQCSVQKGTLSQCSGLCPIDNYINNLLAVTNNQSVQRLCLLVMAIVLLISYI